MTDTLVIDPSGINLAVFCQRAGKAEKRKVGAISLSYSGEERSHIRAELDVIPLVLLNTTPAICRTIEETFALGAQVETAGTCWNRDDDGTTVIVAAGDYTDDMEQGGTWRVPGITLREVRRSGGAFGATAGGVGGFPVSVSPDDPVPPSVSLFHYDAQALVGLSNGDPMTVWPDADNPGVAHDAPSGAGPTFNPSFATGVMNGHPAAFFDYLGNNNRGFSIPGTFAPADGGEAFIVMRGAGTADGAFWNFGSNAFGPHCPTASSGTFRDHFGSSVLRSFVLDVDPTEPFLYHVRARDGEWTCWVNGVQKYTSSSNTATWGTDAFGVWYGSVIVTLFIGWIGELVLRSGFMSTEDAIALEASLMTKWGI